MNLRYALASIVLSVFLGVTACKTSDETANQDPCRVTRTSTLAVGWKNAFTQQDYYDANNKWLSRSYIHPVGTFTIKADMTYDRVSDGVPLSGTWYADKLQCKFVLDKGTTNERSFDVLTLTSDSLTIRRMDGSTMLTQHYFR